jgi:hypothetical protein
MSVTTCAARELTAAHVVTLIRPGATPPVPDLRGFASEYGRALDPGETARTVWQGCFLSSADLPAGALAATPLLEVRPAFKGRDLRRVSVLVLGSTCADMAAAQEKKGASLLFGATVVLFPAPGVYSLSFTYTEAELGAFVPVARVHVESAVLALEVPAP